MKIFGVSLMTIVLLLAAVVVGKKYGGMIPLVKNV